MKNRNKAYSGVMTQPVRFLYNYNRNAVTFRSSNPHGTVSFLYIMGTHRGMYVLANTADKFAEIVKTNPDKTIEQLKFVVLASEIEIHEIIKYYVDNGFGDMIPEVTLDKDEP